MSRSARGSTAGRAAGRGLSPPRPAEVGPGSGPDYPCVTDTPERKVVALDGADSRLEGKTAVVLGASGPYGAAAVRTLAREGVNMALGGRSRDKLEALEEEVREAGAEALIVGTHLAKRHHPVHLVEAAAEHFVGLDFLLFMPRASAPPLKDVNLDAWERSVDVNLNGFLYSVAAALPLMRERGGHVVVLGVEDPETPDPLYLASQAAVCVLLQEMVWELSEEGVRASEIRIGDPRRTSLERCAEAVCRALAEPSSASLALSTIEVP